MRPIRQAFLLLTALTAPLASAHWLPHDELPEWARRGTVQWGHGGNIDGRIKWMPGGFGVDQPNLDLILYCGCNVQQTVGYMDEATRLKAEAAGLKRQPYICSKTIWWETDFKTAPQLEQCTIVKPDGTRVLLYNNPQRYGGCYSSPIWLAYIKDQVRRTLADEQWGRVHSIFFDNASDYDCYCPICAERFRQFTRETFGEAMELARGAEQPNFAFAKKLFGAEMAARFFRDLRAYIDTLNPEAIIAPNLHVVPDWSPYLLSHGATEMLFIEGGFGMPPEESGVLAYKVGLADTHGLVVGQMCGLSEVLRRERALSLDPNNEAGILESFYYPEEHKLAMAEALACNGTYVQSFALREQKIKVSDEPYQVQIREALHQYSSFWRDHPAVYRLAQPGAQVAVLHGIYSQLADRAGHWRALAGVADLLGRAGIPYEVINEEDLQAEQLRGYRLVVAAHVPLLSQEQAAVLADYVRGGGAVLQFGELAQRDLLNRRYAAEALPEIARLTAGEPAALGQGRTWRIAGDPADLDPAGLAQALDGLVGGLPCRVRTPSPRVFANLLRQAGDRALTVHLTNSDFQYDAPPSADVGDDDGLPEARTFLADTRWRVRKVLEPPDLAVAAGYDLKFLSATCGLATDAISLVVSLNGQDIAAFRGSQLNESGWKQVAVPAGLLRTSNEVVFRAEGKPNGHPDWVAFRLDTTAATRRSSWSEDGGQTWTEADLSPDAGTQQGEVVVRLGPHEDPDRVAKVADFVGRLRVQPARDIEVAVQVDGPAPVGRLLSPEGPEQAVTPTQQGNVATYRVSRVDIYAVLVLPGL
jgi:hypothetical protein